MIQTSALDSIVFAARTERGLRDENQDAMTDFRTPFGVVYLVTDGMGGVQGGAEASLITAESFRKYLTSPSPALPIAEALQRAASATNSELRQRGSSGDPSVAGMGSTVVLAVLSASGEQIRGTIAHIGDSRAYLLRQGVLHRLTRDHSTVQRMVDTKQITEEEARHHPDANVITRALGPNAEVLIELSEKLFEPGDTLMLCTDGLCGQVEDSVIAAELARPREAGATADALIALALSSGSSDNITVQVVQIRAREKRGLPALTHRLAAPWKKVTNALPTTAGTTPIRSSWPGFALCFLAGLILGVFLPFAARRWNTPKVAATNQVASPTAAGTAQPCNPSAQGVVTPPMPAAPVAKLPVSKPPISEPPVARLPAATPAPQELHNTVQQDPKPQP